MQEKKRKSISLKRAVYEDVKSFARANNISMSKIVEAEVKAFLDNVELIEKIEQERKSSDRLGLISRIFER